MASRYFPFHSATAPGNSQLDAAFANVTVPRLILQSTGSW
jgi:hypothetical protein